MKKQALEKAQQKLLQATKGGGKDEGDSAGEFASARSRVQSKSNLSMNSRDSSKTNQ